MNRKLAIFLVCLLMVNLLVGCGAKPEASDPPGASQNQNDGGDDTGSSSGSNYNAIDFGTISGFSTEWTRIEEIHEPAINAYDGMPIMELPLASFPLVTAAIYELLNLENKDGRFEGELLLSGYPAYLEKKGSMVTFGYEVVREEDGFSPNDKKDDKIWEEGIFEADKGYLVIETYEERNGVVFEKATYAYKRLSDGTLLCLDQQGHDINSRGSEEKGNTLTFLRMNEKTYEFIVAVGKAGVSYDAITLDDVANVASIENMLADLGYEIESKGAIVDGVFTVASD